MKQIFVNKNLRHLLFINMLFGATEATFAFRATFLSANGISAAQIGLVFSAMSVIAMLAPVIGGVLADKVLSRYQVFVIAVFGFAAVLGFLPLSATIRIGSIIAAMLLMPMVQLFHPVGSAMIATCSINAVAKLDNVDYSFLRLWMSLGYTIASLLFTPLVQHFGINAMYYSTIVCFALILLLRGTIRENETEDTANSEKSREEKKAEAAARKKSANLKGILTNYYIISFVILNVIYATAGTCTSCLSYILEANDIDAAQIGTVAGLKVVGEIIVMLMLPQIKKKFSLSGLQIMAGLFLVLELLSMQFSKTLAMVTFSEMLGGVGNGIYLSTAGLYVRKMAPKGLEATAQSISGIGAGLGGIILSTLFGQIIEKSGVFTNYFLGTILQLSWVVLFIGTLVFGEKVLKKKNICSMVFLKKGEEII